MAEARTFTTLVVTWADSRARSHAYIWSEDQQLVLIRSVCGRARLTKHAPLSQHPVKPGCARCSSRAWQDRRVAEAAATFFRGL